MKCDLVSPTHLLEVPLGSLLLFTPYKPLVFVLRLEIMLLARLALCFPIRFKDLSDGIAVEFMSRFSRSFRVPLYVKSVF